MADHHNEAVANHDDGPGMLGGEDASGRGTGVRDKGEEGVANGGDDEEVLTPLAKKLGFLPFNVASTGLASKGFFNLSLDNPVRRLFIRFMTNYYFQSFVLAIILANCITLAMSSKEPGFEDTTTGVALIVLNNIFTSVFLLEMVAKIGGMGFFLNGKGTYIRDTWNVLDFIVVVLSILDWLPGVSAGDTTSIRTVRVLRPLRTITAVPGLKRLVVSIFRSLPELADVAMLLIFFFLIYSIIGVELLSEVMSQGCWQVTNWTGGPGMEDVPYPTVPDWGPPRMEKEKPEYCSGPLVADYPMRDAPGGGRVCEPGFFCGRFVPQLYGYADYDNVGVGILSTLYHITTEGWTDVMYTAQDALSPSIWLYHCFVVMSVCWFASKVAVAILYVQFSKPSDEDEGGDSHSASTHAAAPANEHGHGHGAHAEAHGEPTNGKISAHHHLPQAVTESFEGAPVENESSVEDHPAKADGDKEEEVNRNNDDDDPTEEVEQAGWDKEYGVNTGVWGLTRKWLRDNIIYKPWFTWLTLTCVVINTIFLAIPFYGMSNSYADSLDNGNLAMTVYFAVECAVKVMGLGPQIYARDFMNLFDFSVVVFGIVELILKAVGVSTANLNVLRCVRLLRVLKAARSWVELRRLLMHIVSSLRSISYLSLLLLLFVFIMAVLGMSFFGYHEIFCDMYNLGASVQPICPPGLSTAAGTCPSQHYYNCYAPCDPATVGIYLEGQLGSYGWAGKPAGMCVPYGPPPIEVNVTTITPSAQGGPPAVSVTTELQYATGTEFWIFVGPSYIPRTNFDDFGSAFIAVFQILSIENWKDVAWDGMRSTHWAAVFYFLFILFCGYYIVLNLFLAIIIESFAEGDHHGHGHGHGHDDHGHDDAHAEDHAESPGHVVPQSIGSGHQAIGSGHGHGPEAAHGGHHMLALPPHSAPESVPAPDASSSNQSLDHEGSASKVAKRRAPGSALSRMLHGPSHRPKTLEEKLKHAAEKQAGGVSSAPAVAAVPAAKQSIAAPMWMRFLVGSKNLMAPLSGNAFGLPFYGPTNPVRVFLHTIISHWAFDLFVFCAIIVSTISLALDSPRLDPMGATKQSVDIMDKVFVAVYAVEMGLKILALGFVETPTSYLRDGWNVLDFIISWIGIVDVLLDVTPPPGMKLKQKVIAFNSIRAIRAVRPLRMLRRIEGIRVVVDALLQALPVVANVAMVITLIFLILSVVGLNLFIGQYYNCRWGISAEGGGPKPYGDVGLLGLEQIDGRLVPDVIFDPLQGLPIIDKAWCTQGYHEISYPPGIKPYNLTHTWTQTYGRSFDHIGAAMLTMFEVGLSSLWLDVMWDGVDSVDINRQPIKSANRFMMFYFIIAYIIVGFFAIEMFVASTIEKFSELKEANKGESVLLSESQKKWVEVQTVLVRYGPLHRPVPPTAAWRKRIFDVVQHHIFEKVVMAVIVATVSVMACRHAYETDPWKRFQFVCNIIFTSIFSCEALLKITAFGFKHYFTNAMHLFDFFIVCVSWLGVALDVQPAIVGNRGTTGLSLVRVLRVGRILRLIPKAPGLLKLFQTLVLSLPALANVGSVMFLSMTVFAIIGMDIFGSLRRGFWIHRHANWEDYPNAMLMLFRMTGDEKWNGVMHECMNLASCILITDPTLDNAGQWLNYQDPAWQPLKENIVGLDGQFSNHCSPSPYGTVVFYMVEEVMVALILTNLFIAVILDSFHHTEDELPITPAQLEPFRDLWARFDPDATKWVSEDDLETMVAETEPPLGTKGQGLSKAKLVEVIVSMDIPSYKGRVHYFEVMHGLASREFGVSLPEETADIVAGLIASSFARVDRSGVRTVGAAGRPTVREQMEAAPALSEDAIHPRMIAVAEEATEAPGGAPGDSVPRA